MISFRALKLYAVMVLCALVFLVFVPSVGNDFVDWDDYSFVVRNPHITSISLRSAVWMLTTFSEGVWHPLTWFSHSLDLALWGPNPGPHHLVSVLIHVLNVALFFTVCGLLQDAWVQRNPSRTSLSETSRFIAALVAALLFGVHPLRVESVTWVAERKDVLCALFYLSSMILYLKYALAGDSGARKRFYLFGVLLFALALLSKPMAVTLPLVLLLLDYFPLYRLRMASFGSLLKEKAPFLLLAAAAMAMNAAAKWGTAIPLSYVPVHMRLMNAFHSIVFYIYQTVFPSKLVPIYEMDRNLDYFGPSFVLAACGVAAITGLCLWRAVKKTRLWAAIWFYYLITLGPAMGFFMAYRHAAADRYTYLPTMGLLLLIGLAAARMWEAAGRLKQPLPAKVGLAAFLLLVTCAYGYQTQKQIAVWKNSETLWRYVIENADYVPDMAYFGVGKALEEKGQLDAALANYEAALALTPQDNRYRRKIAWILAQKGETEKALAMVKENVDREPMNPSAHVNGGKILALLGRYDEAEQSAQKALALNPDFQPAFDLLMMVYLERNDLVKAREYYEKRVSKGYNVPKEIEERLGIRNPRGKTSGP